MKLKNPFSEEMCYTAYNMTRRCKVCKKEFNPIHHSNTICSVECVKKNKSENDKRYRKKNWDKLQEKKKFYYENGGKEKICPTCNEKHYKTAAKYCCNKCYFKAQKEKRKGKKNPNWNGGNHPKSYNRVYKEWVYKEKGLLLEELGCEVCGIMSGVIFDRHHIVFKSEMPRHSEMNNPRNIIQVCRSCHLKLHGKKDRRNEIVEKRNLVELFGDNILK